tara:strand:- start:5672 stop:5893 length:222 start_codon:yes stop_codon:yes gene_type:complete
MKKGHYIWNRADRVDSSVMPQVVLESFDEWHKDLMKEYKFANEKRKTQILNTIKRQKINLDYNLERLGYGQYN